MAEANSSPEGQEAPGPLRFSNSPDPKPLKSLFPLALVACKSESMSQTCPLSLKESSCRTDMAPGTHGEGTTAFGQQGKGAKA